MFSVDNGKLYPDNLGRLVPNYLKAIPDCPEVGRDTYYVSYRHVGNRFTLFCAGYNHRGCPTNFPAFSSTKGLLSPK